MGRIDELRAFVEEVHPDLDLYSYYQLLELESGASSADIRAAFYRQAARLHPDRFAGLAEPGLRDKLVAIYARIAEAYKVLSDSRKRAAYDAGMAQGQMRYQEMEREKKGPQNPEDAVTKPEAKKFLRLALTAQRAGDFKGAAMNFKFALSYEPSNEWLQQQAAAAEAIYKAKGTGLGVR
jgi:DnaJ-class molecular chaperone